MARLDTHLRLPQQTRDRLDAIVARAREAGESYPATRTDAVVMAIDLLWKTGEAGLARKINGKGARNVN